MRRNRYVIDTDNGIGITQIVFLCLFLVGMVSLMIFTIWLVSGFMFAFGEASHPGDIAYVPKSIFLFSPLVLLGYTRSLRSLLDKF